jgi:hypothetical protein
LRRKIINVVENIWDIKTNYYYLYKLLLFIQIYILYYYILYVFLIISI